MNVLKYFLIILIPPVLILGNFRYLIFNLDFYQKLYRETQVYNSFSENTVNNATYNLFGFFRGKNQLEYNFYSEQARLHLTDVREILNFTFGVFYLMFGAVSIISLLMIIKRSMKYLLQAFLTSSVITVVAILLLALGIFNSFDAFFFKFHQIIFTNNLWQFGPDDNLIKLFPQEFFVAFANRLAQNIIITSLIILAVSVIFLKKAKR